MTIEELIKDCEERIEYMNNSIKKYEEPANPLWFVRGQRFALTQVLTDLEILRQHYDI